jgi:hypothetical protein
MQGFDFAVQLIFSVVVGWNGFRPSGGGLTFCRAVSGPFAKCKHLRLRGNQLDEPSMIEAPVEGLIHLKMAVKFLTV